MDPRLWRRLHALASSSPLSASVPCPEQPAVHCSRRVQLQYPATAGGVVGFDLVHPGSRWHGIFLAARCLKNPHRRCEFLHTGSACTIRQHCNPKRQRGPRWRFGLQCCNILHGHIDVLPLRVIQSGSPPLHGESAAMLSVAEAQALVIQHVRPLTPQTVPLSSAALGLVLAEDVASDIDMPPFDKSLMDGLAIRCADLPEGHGVLTIIEEVTAGTMPQMTVGAGQAIRIMTGAPIPRGADAVVIVERTRAMDGDRIQVDDRPPKPGQNILPRGKEMRKGETVLKAGAVLGPQDFGVLASVGRTSIMLHAAPEVALLSTGDEIVEPSQTPGPGQIRNGNGLMLLAQVTRAGGLPRFLGIAGDQVESLRPLIAEGLQSPILVLSGGVSAGKLDLVPGVLRDSEVGWRVQAVPWFGSPELRGLISTNAFIVFPAGDHQHRAGQRFSVLRTE